MDSHICIEETITSETVYDGGLITVRRDTVRVANGKTATREIVEHQPVVVMAPVDADGQLLFVRQYRKPIERVLIEVPAGAIESGESAEDAVRREMREETGYDPKRIEPITTIYPSPGFTDEVMHVFAVYDLEGDGQPSEPLDELQVVRVPVETAREMVRTGQISDAKSVVAVLMLKS